MIKDIPIDNLKKPKKRVIVAGGRDFNNFELLKNKCDYYLQNQSDIVILSGGCAGADKLGEIYAKEKNFGLEMYIAQWHQHGKAAGPIRNELMAKTAHLAIIFWNGKSRGTANMIALTEKYNIPTRIIYY